MSPRSAWLCIPFALSTLTDGTFSCACTHTHTMGLSECDEIVHLIDDLSLLLEAKRRDAIAKAAVSDAAVSASGGANGAALAATAAADANLVAGLNEHYMRSPGGTGKSILQHFFVFSQKCKPLESSPLRDTGCSHARPRVL